MLPERDKDAIYALLVRQVEAQELNAKAVLDLADANRRIAAAKAATSGIRAALGIFGFDMTVERPWDQIMDALGSNRYSKAIAVGKGEICENLALPAPTDDHDEHESEDESDGEEDEGSPLASPSDEEDTEQQIPSNIRDLVISLLRAAGSEGSKVAPIKAAILAQGIEMHEKTVGMTLYRLSKDGLARRLGRTWFFIIPKGEMENPDAGASGLFGEGN